jgi:hypothetical protein
MNTRVWALFPLALVACAAEAKPPADPLWLSGYWLSCTDGLQVSETWSDRRDGVMIGVGFTSGKGQPSWEFSRIGPSAAGISFFAMPSGQSPAEFPLAADKSSDTRLVFENSAHDFPQRVIYARDGKALAARIEGVIGGEAQAMDWRYEPAALNQSCPG